jgi:hypothetical protein
MTRRDLKGLYPDSWACIDCGINTAPGLPNRAQAENELAADVLKVKEGIALTVTDQCEIYTVRERVWKVAGMEPWGGCLCIGCLEKRLGRELTPKDFKRDDPFASLPGTMRLMDRRGDRDEGHRQLFRPARLAQLHGSDRSQAGRTAERFSDRR